MKKFLALLLVLCMLVSLIACGKKTDTPDATDGSQPDKGQSSGGQVSDIVEGWEDAADKYEEGKDYSDATGNAGDNVDGQFAGTNELIGGNANNGEGEEAPVKFANNNDLINPAHAGKTIEIYGLAGAEFDDIEEMGQGNYLWMVRAAVDEWAAMNKVNIVYEGNYDQSTLVGKINSGAHPDLLLYGNSMPAMANLGITRAFTDAEYAQLADTCGNSFLDMVNFKGKSYGVNYPWAGNFMFHYNETLFERYGVKSPKEYYMEDNWTWETMEKCITEITRDTDDDGKVNIYGIGAFNLQHGYEVKENNDGTLTDLTATSPQYYKYLEIKYRGSQTGAIGPYGYVFSTSKNRPATHMGDTEWYRHETFYNELDNGDICAVVMMPRFEADKPVEFLMYTDAYMSIFSTCDEPEATLDLITYILRVGMRYMSDYSCGLFKCEYEGMRGASLYSKGWKENFADIVAERQEEFDAIKADGNWDEEYVNKLINDVAQTGGFIIRRYAGKTDPTGTGGLPPASQLPIIVANQNAWISKYNNLYAN